MNTTRIIYVILLGLTIALGLVTRSSWFSERSPTHLYAGDALWALAVFWSLAVLRPCAPTRHFVIGALIIAFTIELTQLYHTEWINHLRSYRIGALILGHTFVWSDIACYTAGVWFGANIDNFLIKKEWESPWNWWLNSTIKDKFIILGSIGMVGNALFFLLDLVLIKLLSVSLGFLFIGFMMRSEDSTEI